MRDLFYSKYEIKNYLESLPLEKIKEMVEYPSYEEQFQHFLMEEYWSRINTVIDGDEE